MAISANDATWLARLADDPMNVDLRMAYSRALSRRGAERMAALLRLSAEEIRLKEIERSSRRVKERDRKILRDIQCQLLMLSYRVHSKWLVRVDPALAIPNGLSKLGIAVASTIVDYLGETTWEYGSDGNVFYLPSEASEHPCIGPEPVVLVMKHSEDVGKRLCADLGAGECLDDRLAKLGAWMQNDQGESVIYPMDYTGPRIGLDFVREQKGYRNPIRRAGFA
jgi:hypothetical protein